MSNNGKLKTFPQSKFTSLRVIPSKKYTKIWAINQVGHITITVDNKQAQVLDLETLFKPASFNMHDYFLRVSSPIKGGDQFYHDMNGYLVSKRKIGQRLDYEWKYALVDKINANTYPMCSFGYTSNRSKKVQIR